MGKRVSILMRFRNYITAVVGCLLLLTVAGCAYYTYRLSRIVPETQRQLSEVLHTRKQHIVDVITSVKQDVISLADDPQVRQYTQDVLAGGSASAPAVLQRMTSFRNVMIIAPDGTIQAAHPSNDIVGNNVLQDFSDTQMRAAFMRASMTTTIDVARYSIEQHMQGPALYITYPLHREGAVVGFMMVDVSTEPIQNIVTDYHGLQSSGEILISRDAGTGAFTVFPTRHDPYAAFNRYFAYDRLEALPVQKASQGYAGQAVTQDYRGISAISVWSFVPQVNWGIVAKIDYNEVATPYLQQLQIWYGAAGILAILLLVIVYGLYARAQRIMQSAYVWMQQYVNWRRVLLIGVIASVLGMTGAWFMLYQSQNARITSKIDRLTHTAQEQAYYMRQELDRVATIADAIAQDLTHGRLFKKDIPIRLRRVMQENAQTAGVIVAFAPHAYSEQKRLHAPAAYRENGELVVNRLTHDYTKPSGAGEPDTHWYREVIDDNAQWLLPYYDALMQKRVIPYAVPFRNAADGSVAGVVAVLLDYNSITEHIRRLQLGPHEYSFIIDEAGILIYHPEQHYVDNRQALDVVEQQQGGSSLLSTIANAQQQSDAERYYDAQSRAAMWCVYTNMDHPQWSLGIVFPEQESQLPRMQLYHHYIWIFVWTILVGIFAILWGMYQQPMSIPRARMISACVSILLAGALLLFWYSFSQFPWRSEAPDAVVVADQQQKDMFVQSWRRSLQVRNISVPLVIPIGLYINGIDFVSSNYVEITGELWYRIPSDQMDIHPENMPLVYFPEAKETEFTHIYTQSAEGGTVMRWKFVVQKATSHNYTYFPFDIHTVSLPCVSRDVQERIMFVPYISSYTQREADNLGIQPDLRVSGFTLQSSTFMFVPHRKQMTWKAGTDRMIDTMRLQYDIRLVRRLTNSFIVFFIPLLVVLITLFIRFLITRKKEEETALEESVSVYGAMRTYLAVFFSLIILHQTLRNQYQIGKFLYIEYLFFFSYIVIIMLLTYSLLLRISTQFRRRVAPYMQLMALAFWPANLLLWLVTTLIVFY